MGHKLRRSRNAAAAAMLFAVSGLIECSRQGACTRQSAFNSQLRFSKMWECKFAAYLWEPCSTCRTGIAAIAAGPADVRARGSNHAACIGASQESHAFLQHARLRVEGGWQFTHATTLCMHRQGTRLLLLLHINTVADHSAQNANQSGCHWCCQAAVPNWSVEAQDHRG